MPVVNPPPSGVPFEVDRTLPVIVTTSSQINVLIVDDEPRNLDVLEAVLESPDYRLIRAESPDAALLALISGEFAAIVLDVQLPGMTGLELAHLIKQRKRTQDIPIIFLTAYFPEERFVLEGYQAGAVDYLTKPLNPQILRSKVNVFVDLYRKTRALAELNGALAGEIDQRREAEEALRRANSELERRVTERTADLTLANNGLRESAQALQESEGRFRLLADTSPVLIWMDGPDGSEFHNQAFVAFFGLPSRELLGYRWTTLVHPEDGDAFVAEYRSTADGGKPFRSEARMRRSDGEWRWLLFHVVPRHTRDGELLGRVGSCTDVTALKEVGEVLQRARDEAVAASRAKDDFLAALSHELRTPLNPVLMIASDAAENAELADAVRADFATIRKNIEVEAGLIDDLLDLTRITRGKLAFDSRVLDAHRVLDEVLQAAQTEVDRKGLVLELELAASHATIISDPVRLQQVFWNLVSNAVKFTPGGGHVRVSTRNSDEALIVTVTDTGIGMSPEELARVFDPFSQGDHAIEGISRRFGGLGLGLTIARRLVEHHGGRITASSPGRSMGATLMIELPLHAESGAAEQGPDRPPQSAQAPVPESSTNGMLKSLRVLLVEDHSPTRTTLSRLLARRGHAVASSATMADALTLFENQEFDLLISDIGLPDGDGCDLMRRIRQERPGLAGIALSGYGMKEDLMRSHSAGFDLHFTKPIDVRALDRAIADLVAKRGARSD